MGCCFYAECECEFFSVFVITVLFNSYFFKVRENIHKLVNYIFGIGKQYL